MKSKAPFLLITMTVILSSCASTKEYCEPGHELVVVPRNAMKAYQAYVKTTDASVKATIDITETLKIADLDVGTKSKVTKLRQDLDQFSSRYQDVIKASYLAFTQAPCDKDIRKNHYALLSEMSKQNAALESLRIELDKIVKAGHFAGPDEAKIKSLIDQYNAASTAENIK
jgi:hypothetical protein